MSITKQQFLKAASCDFQWVEVDPFGKVGIRSCPQVQLSRRLVSYRDPATQMVTDQYANADVHRIIDQVMVDENTPMFTEDDVESLNALSSAKLVGILQALDDFDAATGNGQKKVKGE